MMTTGVGLAMVRAATWLGWIAFLACMIPGLPDELARRMAWFGIAVGPTGAIVLAMRRCSLVVSEIFEAGRRVGESSGSEGRRLRVVARGD